MSLKEVVQRAIWSPICLEPTLATDQRATMLYFWCWLRLSKYTVWDTNVDYSSISKCQVAVIVCRQSEQELYQCPLASYINNQTVWEKYAKSSQLLTAYTDKYESTLIAKKNSAKLENSMNICPRGAVKVIYQWNVNIRGLSLHPINKYQLNFQFSPIFF